MGCWPVSPAGGGGAGAAGSAVTGTGVAGEVVLEGELLEGAVGLEGAPLEGAAAFTVSGPPASHTAVAKHKTTDRPRGRKHRISS